MPLSERPAQGARRALPPAEGLGLRRAGHQQGHRRRDPPVSVDAVKAHLRVLFERFGLDDLPQNQKRARLAAVALVNGVVKQHEF